MAAFLREGEQSFTVTAGETVADQYSLSQDRDDVQRPTLLNRPMPSYTDRAREKGVEGIVRARVLIGEDGKVQQVIVVRRLPEGLTHQAVRAIRRLRFKPAMRNGQPIKFWQAVDVEFKLRKR